MSDPSPNLDRMAQEVLARIDERRAVAALTRQGHEVADIAHVMSATEQHVRRVSAAIDVVGVEVTPEETILRAWVTGSDRRELVARLSDFSYTSSEYAPYPAEGKRSGTWEQVRGARMSGYLTDAEFQAVAERAAPPRDVS